MKGKESRLTGKLSKFSTPSSSYWLPRTRLFRILDNFRHAPVIWISAPAGSGKTVLAASYLAERKSLSIWYRVDKRDEDPGAFFYFLREAFCQAGFKHAEKLPLLTAEYAGGEEVYARNFCEALFAEVPDNFVLVLDNFQNLPESSLTLLLLPAMLDSVPNGNSVLILSRQQPPACMARLSVNQHMNVLGEAQVRFTLDETLELIDGWPFTNDVTADASALYKSTQGWAAATVLTLKSLANDGSLTVMQRGVDPAVFDYLAVELLADMELATKNFLLVTSLLPQFDINLASDLTGCDNAISILKNLMRNNLFVYHDEGGIYHYHPLFRQLLLRLIEQEWNTNALNDMRIRAAEALLGRNDTETALSLFESARAWPQFISTLLDHANAMMAQGRHRELNDWLCRIPESVEATIPWVTFWRATALLPVDLSLSYQLYSKAYTVFCELDDVDGIVQAWIGAVDAVIYSLSDTARLDQWLQYFEQKLSQYSSTSQDTEGQLASRVTSVLILRQPQHPELDRWRQKAEQNLSRISDVNQRIISGFYLLTYSIWRGDLSEAAALLERMSREQNIASLPPLAATTYHLSRAWLAWTSGQYDACIEALKKGLVVVEESGVYVWYAILLMQGSTNALIHGDPTEGEEYISRLTPTVIEIRDMDRAYYYIDRAWYQLSKGELLQALESQRRAIKAADDFGAVYTRAEAYFGMAEVQHELGEYAEANRYLQQAMSLGQQFNSWTMYLQCQLAMAQFALDAADLTQAVSILQPLLEQIRQRGIVIFNSWRPKVIARLMACCIKNNICSDVALNLIKQYHLPAPHDECVPDWPHPIKIYTLGRFSVLKDDQPIRFETRAQKKPFELLKVLLAKGGRDVSEETLTETLWPDADGDAAHSAFSTTLSRLRKLLGQEALLLRDGKLSLNNTLCWVDVWTMERAITQLNQALTQHHSATQVDAILQPMLDRYQGDFLQAETSSWVLTTRERIKGKVLAAIKKVIAASDDCQRVIALYEKALQLDPLSEESYRGLMACLAAQGNPAQACALYERCRTMLQTTFGIQPTETTRQLADAITRQDQTRLQKHCSMCKTKTKLK